MAFLAALVILGALVFLLVYEPDKEETGAIVVYCAAGLKNPVADAIAEFEKELNVPVHISYAGSGSLLAQMEISQRGDIYIPADESYIDLARKKQLVEEAIPAGDQTVVLAFRKGNPKNIQSLEDVRRSDLTLSMANPDQAAVGKVTRKALQETGLWEPMQSQISVFKPTVNDVATDVKIGTVDAAFMWDSLLHQYPDLETLPALHLKQASARVMVSVLSATEQPAAALRLARYLTAPQKGARHWTNHGFKAIPGDDWAVKPNLRILSGAMLRPAVDETITAFTEREGVEVTRVYNGCGILVSQMKAGEHPDAYFSCDTSFMVDVQDLFRPSEDISKNRLVLIVPKGNPKNVLTLQDLTRKDLVVGVGHETKGAMGALTKKMLQVANLYEPVMKNIKVQSATGDFLINQLRTGSLDVVIAYISNAAASRDHLDTIDIDLPGAIAIQPFAIGKESSYPLLMARLIQAIKTTESRKKFEDWGFDWMVKPAATTVQ